MINALYIDIFMEMILKHNAITYFYHSWRYLKKYIVYKASIMILLLQEKHYLIFPPFICIIDL